MVFHLISYNNIDNTTSFVEILQILYQSRSETSVENLTID